MNRIDPLQPAYDFSSAPEPVKLIEGTVEVLSGNNKLSGTADLLLRFLPTPRLIFSATIRNTLKPDLPSLFNATKILSLSFNSQKIEGFLGKWRENLETLELDWHPKFEPITLCDMRPETSVAAIFHLFNFPDFQGGQHQATMAPEQHALLMLESEEWRITLQSLPNGIVREAWEQIKKEGGHFLTHIAKLERKDSKPFSGEEAQKQCFLLTNFLSFVKGGRCPTICEVGLDKRGDKTWETFSSPRTSNPSYSWFTPIKAHQAELLFPLFAKRWQQSEEWKDCLHSAIYWYAQANTSSGFPSIDAGIILAQSALERLAHHHLVVDKKMISKEGLNKLKVPDRLRLLFSSLNLPVDISTATPEIQKVAPSVNWVDAPHALVDIRNELVHPVSKKPVTDCFFDAWKLSLWYLELSVLALCDYDATYTSRLTAKYFIDFEKVPWAK